MASDDELGISFDFSHSQQSFRLMELPPPLLELLSSDNPPTLSLKSAIPPSASKGASSPTSSNAVLCTSSQTFHLRQVHSSNSIFLVHPSGDQALDSGQTSASSGISVTATCKATLELHPTTGSPIPYLEQHLTLYDGIDHELDALSGIGSSPADQEKASKLEVFSNVPFSEDECESAWTEICAFELRKIAIRPTARALAGVWKAILSGATSQAIRLSSEFQLQELCTVVEDNEYPREVIEAVIRRLSSEDATQGSACLDRTKCVEWVGKIILESQRYPNAGMPVTLFLKAWKDNLPEEWQKYATLDVIKGAFSQPTASMILPSEGGASTVVADNGVSKPNAAASKASTGGRRWHERFKAAR